MTERAQKQWRAALADLHSGNVKRAVRASDTLDALATPEHVPELYALMARGNFFIREAVAVPLGRLEGAKALPTLLWAIMQSDPDDGYYSPGLNKTIEFLLERHAAAAAPLLLSLMEAADPVQRRWAVCAFGHIAAQVDAAPLLKHLQDADAGVRETAVVALAFLPGVPGVVAAVLPLLQDPAEVVQLCAAHTLGMLGDRQALPALQALTQHPKEWMRYVASYSLDRLGG